MFVDLSIFQLFFFLSFYKERYTQEYVKLAAGFGGSTCVYIFIFLSICFLIFESFNVLSFSNVLSFYKERYITWNM